MKTTLAILIVLVSSALSFADETVLEKRVESLEGSLLKTQEAIIDLVESIPEVVAISETTQKSPSPAPGKNWAVIGGSFLPLLAIVAVLMIFYSRSERGIWRSFWKHWISTFFLLTYLTFWLAISLAHIF